MERHTNPIETIIYGGAFCPPTRAHQAILQACVDTAREHQGDVWLLPSADRRDKTIALSRERRLALCAALLDDISADGVLLRIDETELNRNEPTETIDTVHEFADMHPNRRFRWVFGADSVATMHEWEGGDWMLENLDMLLIARRGAVAPNLGANALFLTVHTGNESSTELRRRIASQEPYGDMVGPAVYRELVSVGAY